MLDDPAFDHFYSEGLITDVIRPVKGGKEASVYLCRANRSTTGRNLLALKVYHAREHRTFRNDAVYKDGRVVLNHRTRRAMAKKTAFGRAADDGWWQSHEFETLRTLHAAGADVPEALACADGAILMQYLGDEETPAPQLRHVSLSSGDAEEVLGRLLWNVEVALANNVIHADLSAFNVLWWDGEATIIDLPQAVDPRTNHSAYALLGRDVENLCRHFARIGIERDASAITADLWTRFLFAEL